MSGICAIFHLEGQPVDPQQLQQLTTGLTYRGPEGLHCWQQGAIGLGHTLFRTTAEAIQEEQPCTLEGQIYLTADARFDGREALISTLRAQGEPIAGNESDGVLMLHAYRVWGQRFLDHLLGDFAFVLWDGRTQTVLAGRDHFGLRPLYYAHRGSTLVLSNSMGCVQRYPGVSRRLNDQAIGDWLVLGQYTWLDKSITTFADIQQVPPAHLLVADRQGVTVQRYWDLPLDTPELHYRQPQDYLAHFREVMAQAVGDRLRSDRVVISMSGGLDSTTIAATACQLVRDGVKQTQLTAFTAVYDRIHPDQERYYSSLVAQKLQLPHHIFVCDDYPLVPPQIQTPEPNRILEVDMMLDRQRQQAALGRVVLTGRSGDSVLQASPPTTMVQLCAHRSPIQALSEILRLRWRYGVQLPLGSGILAQANGRRRQPCPYPNWVNPDFAARLGLHDRWHQLQHWTPTPIHPRHPDIHTALMLPSWAMTQEFQPGMDFAPSAQLDPFLDLRLVEFVLSLPPLPWCFKKYLLRQAMQGQLPNEVLTRKKTPLGRLKQSLFVLPQLAWLDHWDPVPELLTYVQPDAIPSLTDGHCEYPGLHYRPIMLNRWLQAQMLASDPALAKRSPPKRSPPKRSPRPR